MTAEETKTHGPPDSTPISVTERSSATPASSIAMLSTPFVASTLSPGVIASSPEQMPF